MPYLKFRAPLAALLAAALVGACATLPQPAAPDQTPPAAPVRDEAASARPAPPAPKPRPARPDKDKSSRPDKPGGNAGEPPAEEAPAPATPALVPAPAPAAVPLAGPAWLSLCVNREMEGGVIRCDADQLLAQPSPQVKIFTREPAAAGHGKAGSIQFRAGLPRKYRFFVVP